MPSSQVSSKALVNRSTSRSQSKEWKRNSHNRRNKRSIFFSYNAEYRQELGTKKARRWREDDEKMTKNKASHHHQESHVSREDYHSSSAWLFCFSLHCKDTERLIFVKRRLWIIEHKKVGAFLASRQWRCILWDFAVSLSTHSMLEMLS